MKVSYTITIPKGKDAVMKMFCDPAYHAELQKALGAVDFQQLEHVDDGKKFRIKMGYNVPAAGLPGFAKKILGEMSSVVQEESWDRTTGKGEVSIQVKNLPGSMKSVNALTESGGTTTKTFNWDVTVKIPLVGGKLEELIVNDIKSKVAPEQATGRRLVEKY